MAHTPKNFKVSQWSRNLEEKYSQCGKQVDCHVETMLVEWGETKQRKECKEMKIGRTKNTYILWFGDWVEGGRESGEGWKR